MDFNTRRNIVLIGLVVVLFSAFAVFLLLGRMQEPLSIQIIFGKIYQAIFGRPL